MSINIDWRVSAGIAVGAVAVAGYCGYRARKNGAAAKKTMIELDRVRTVAIDAIERNKVLDSELGELKALHSLKPVCVKDFEIPGTSIATTTETCLGTDSFPLTASEVKAMTECLNPPTEDVVTVNGHDTDNWTDAKPVSRIRVPEPKDAAGDPVWWSSFRDRILAKRGAITTCPRSFNLDAKSGWPAKGYWVATVGKATGILHVTNKNISFVESMGHGQYMGISSSKRWGSGMGPSAITEEQARNFLNGR